MASRGRNKEKTMPVELAIQRELAYRRKIAALRLRRPNTNSTEQILPLQVIIPSNQASHLKPLSGSSSRPFSSSNLSGTKRKEFRASSATAHHHDPQHHQPFHGSINHRAETDNLYCKICQLSCMSPFNLKQHLIGQKHKKKLQELEFSEMGGREGRSHPRCEICNVFCMNEDLLKLHFQGQKHKAKLQDLTINKQDEEDPNSQKWCEVCKLWCINEFSFKQHLQGKKHIIQLHAME